MHRRRILPLALVFSLLLLTIAGRLFWLQGLNWREFHLMAESIQRMVHYPPSPRGKILDRNGTALATDVPAVSVNFLLSEIEPVRWVARRMSRVLGAADERFLYQPEELWRSLQVLRERLRPKFGSEEALGRHLWLTGISPPAARRLARATEERPEHYRGIVVEASATEGFVSIDPELLFCGEIGVRRIEIEEGFEPGSLMNRVEAAYARVQDGSRKMHEREWIYRHQQHRLLDDAPAHLVLDIVGHPEKYPGLHLVEVTRRAYPISPLLGQLIGHARPPRDVEFAAWKARGEVVIDHHVLRGLRTFEALRPDSHHSADRIGQGGLELSLEELLRGRSGAEVIVVDHRRRSVGEPIATVEPISGVDVSLQLEVELCQELSKLLQERDPVGGSILVADVTSGELIGWASHPEQGPEVFGDRALYRQRMESDRMWFFDRPSRWPLEPGSSFKPLVAIAALEEGVVGDDETILCDGVYDPQNPSSLRCRNHPHGLEIGLEEALARSCNVFFYHLGERLGIAALRDWGDRFGFWTPTDCGAPGEKVGIAPLGSPQGTAIGKGFTTTPLRLLAMTCTIAGRGHSRGLSLLSGSRGPDIDVDARAASWERVIAGMEEAVRQSHGTASDLAYRLSFFDCAVKTGTVEIRGSTLNDAWIIGFAPVREPRFAWVVNLQEVTGHGGDECAPLSARILEFLEGRPGESLRFEGAGGKR